MLLCRNVWSRKESEAINVKRKIMSVVFVRVVLSAQV
ncbi:unnamed protein product [Brassica rapa]|uniref:Uncharacterized protein n=2 Tax=Brassica TaxID=3705 RepID=A0A8D9HBJ9_BRACM|nr:unnamed protein product [Brassica napus]CAG7894891.1 unnamed protein product [Brassica rapa]